MPDLAADRDAIRHLLAVYTYNGDRGRIDALAACFAEDGVLEFTGKAPRGPAAIAEALTSGDRNPAVTFVRHHVTNPLIEVTGDSAEARSWWSRHEVLRPASGTKRLRHQLLGEITFNHVVLQVADDPDLKLVTFSAADGNQEPLARLAATITPP